VPLLTTAYNVSGSLPVVGTRTGVFAAIGNPVVVVTPEPPPYAVALEVMRTPFSGTAPVEHTSVAVVHADRPRAPFSAQLGPRPSSNVVI
jgi:hypothetical protein